MVEYTRNMASSPRPQGHYFATQPPHTSDTRNKRSTIVRDSGGSTHELLTTTDFYNSRDFLSKCEKIARWTPQERYRAGRADNEAAHAFFTPSHYKQQRACSEKKESCIPRRTSAYSLGNVAVLPHFPCHGADYANAHLWWCYSRVIRPYSSTHLLLLTTLCAETTSHLYMGECNVHRAVIDKKSC